MKKRLLIPLLASLMLLACGGLPAAPTMTRQASPSPSQSPSPLVTPTRAPTRAPTLPPSFLPGSQVSFHHLRVEFSTRSDWSTLDLPATAHFLTGRLMEVTGSPQHAGGSTSRLELNQPLADAEAGVQVGMTYDLALDASTSGQALDFLLQKGAIGGSVVRVWLVQTDGSLLLGEVSHQGVVENNPGYNPRAFTITAQTLAGIAPQVRSVGAAGSQRLLWAFYYPWYRYPDWDSPILQDHPLEAYNSSHRGVIQRHIQQAQNAGLDGFISSWWGPGDFTSQNLSILLDLAAEADFKVMAYLETLNDSGGRPPDELYRWLKYLITTFGEHPAYMRLDDKPVVVLWATAAVPLADWQSILDRLRAEGLDCVTIGMGYDLSNLSVFDGLHDYAVFGYADLAGTLAQTGQATRYYSLLDEDARPKLWAATVQPGYDDRTIPGRLGQVQERLEGAFYRATWQAAVASNPDWIFITSWNEWWEHTHIEPSTKHGDLYLQITREMAEMWKGSP